jgi:hypothetical protein
MQMETKFLVISTPSWNWARRSVWRVDGWVAEAANLSGACEDRARKNAAGQGLNGVVEVTLRKGGSSGLLRRS